MDTIQINENIDLITIIISESGGTGTTLTITETVIGFDVFVTGGTYSNGTAIFTNNIGNQFNVTGFNTGVTNTISGTGTTNTIPKFNSTSGLTNSHITDNGILVTLTTDARINSLTVGKGNNNLFGNTAFGIGALAAGISNGQNTAIGFNALAGVTAGFSNVAIGLSSQVFNKNGTFNTSVGNNSLGALSGGSNNIGIGYHAGDLYTGNFNMRNPNKSIFIGNNTKANDENQTNQIVIGDTVIGLGSDSISIGNSATTKAKIYGALTADTIAKVGGLSSQYLMADGSTSTGSGGFDNYVTGGTYTNNNGTLSLKDRSGNTITITGFTTGGTNNSTSGISGTGTTNTIPKFSSSSAITNSNISDNGSLVTISSNTNIVGNVTGSTFVKNGGTSSQFLKGDGSVDSTVYANDSNVIHTTGNEIKNGNLTLNNDLILTNLTLFTGTPTNIGADNTGKIVTVPIDESLVVTCTNKTGFLIPKGSAVYINGAQGSKATIDLAVGDSNLTTSLVIGLTQTDIANNASGFVVVEGIINSINTSSFSNGDRLYVSTTPGGLTNVIPTSPNNAMFVGTVTNSHSSQGSILINITYNVKLDRLIDVGISSPTDGQILTYETSSGLWKNKNNSALLSGGVINSITKWSSSTGITNSNISDTGSLVTISSNTSIVGNLTATTIVKSGGLSNQFLMADGSVMTVIDGGSF